MKRWWIATLAALAFWAYVSPGQALAQLGSYNRPYSPKPTLSPYLNMFQSGNPAINYYGLVRPQIATSKSLQYLQQEITDQDQYLMNMPTQNQQGQMPLPATGHPVQFMNYSHYFPMMRGATGTFGGGRFQAGVYRR